MVFMLPLFVLYAAGLITLVRHWREMPEENDLVTDLYAWALLLMWPVCLVLWLALGRPDVEGQDRDGK